MRKLFVLLLVSCAGAPRPIEPLGKNAQGAEEFRRAIDGMIVVRIPAGEFVTGDDHGDLGEGKKRPAKIDYDYFIDKYEVSNGQFARFLNAVGIEKDEQGRGYVDGRISGIEKGDQGWRATPGRENHPVTAATYWGAAAYAKWVGGSIPDRLEWEKGARGTDGRTYPWGEDAPDPTYCNFGPSQINDTVPVGSYPKGASAYGVMDMAGNVYERTRGQGGRASGIRSSGFLCPMAFQMRCSDGCGYDPNTSNVSVGFRTVSR